MQSVKMRLLYPDSKMPRQASDGAVGFDAYAHAVLNENKECVDQLPYTLLPGQKVLIGIGVAFALPWGFECQVRPRSGLANRFDIELSNSPGTIDPDFRGEAGVLLRNRGDKPFVIEKDMRIAQLIFSTVEIPVFEVVTELPGTRRGGGGFGSTGLLDIKLGTEAFAREVYLRDIFYMDMAIAASKRSNCARGCQRGSDNKYLRDGKGRLIGQTRRFGCVIVKNDNAVSIGWNAQVPGMPLCAEVGCLREEEGIKSGERIERCRALHAEEMAFQKMLATGVGTPTAGATMYVTAEPCEVCAKSIVGSGIETLVLLKGVYPNNGLQIVRDGGVNVRFVDKEDLN